MEITAKLAEVQAVQSGTSKSGNTWQKQNIILETDGMYPKKVCVSLWGDKVNDPTLVVGSTLTVSIDLESREYNGSWFTDVRAWKIESKGAVNSPPPTPQVEQPGDDLPF